ncbi:acyl-CoA dehydrogenase family protein [Gordonia hydrophobica]|uniref:Acyl-CoA dehydrogenase family protein n=1 Tax=Gordonia hydrophobica TaxID=40516 RepID=A0ABZ2U0R2_9ACTN|nr:acyl-CoA dehydrogenase family protein [Gordonia hydrophobica]MBM7367724.1 alkylation response protein AidB-like acyl-CoA dehydrogenase [Gordonia hydrophobica]
MSGADVATDYVPALLTDEVEEDLRAAVRDLLSHRTDHATIIGGYDGAPQPDLWPEMAQLGLAGLLIAEEHGGAGATPAVAAVVLEELGALPARTPMLTSAIIAATTLTVAADTEYLPGLADGSVVAAVAVPFSTSSYDACATVGGDGDRLSGRVVSVAGTESATIYLVPGADGALYVVDATDVVVTATPSLDMTRPVADVVLENAPGRRVTDDAAGALRAGLTAGAALLASEQAGIARWCVTETVGYLQQRRQFGRIVGGFQAVKHRLADLYADAEQASAIARAAAVTLADRGVDADESALTTAVAAAYCGDLAVRAAEEAVQLHGGIGMTWEHPAHLYLKRAKADQIALGTPGRHRAALADLADLPA